MPIFSSPGVYAWGRELSLIFLFSPFRGGGGNGVRNNKQWPLKGLIEKKNDICFLPPGVNAWAREGGETGRASIHGIVCNNEA
jgi:hypothetical protein